MHKNNFINSALFAIWAVITVQALACPSITVHSTSTCDDIAGAAGIDVTLFKNYNPGLNCSSLQAGQELCIGPGAHIKNVNVIGEIEVTNNNPVVTTLSATGVNVVHLDAEGSGKVISHQLEQRSESSQSDWSNGQWGTFSNRGCQVNPIGHSLWMSPLLGPTGDAYTACTNRGAVVNGLIFSKPSNCVMIGFNAWGSFLVEDKTCLGRWSPVQDMGCGVLPSDIGFRLLNSTLRGYPNGFGEAYARAACEASSMVYKDTTFLSPTRCSLLSSSSGITTTDSAIGYFRIPDNLCGVPPCLFLMVWDYKSGMCMPCSWNLKTPPAPLPDNQIGRPAEYSLHLWARFREISARRAIRGLLSTDTTSTTTHQNQKRIGCFPFNFPGPGRIPPDMPNSLEAWGGNGSDGEGPSASEIASNDTIRQVFQEAWNASYPSAQTMLEQGGWIYANPNNPRRDFYIRRATPLASVSSTNPPANSLSMPLGNPSRSLAGLRAGYVMVATFHTHPGGYQTNNYGNTAIPSPQDNEQEWRGGVPGIIIHNGGLTAYGPARRAIMDTNVPNFPMRNTGPPNVHDIGARIPGWVPRRPRNQPRVTNHPSSSGSCPASDGAGPSHRC